ncbi:MAG: hypothetical protein JWQ94_2918 [Tardiphaga sp.]|nr:hypothetical protein [Tardiphaga sp.]
MSHYRAYFIGNDGHFIKATDVVAADDTAAVIAARALIGKHAIELWQRDRKIAQFDVFRKADATAALDLRQAS